ncbi:MAG: hypothetical protein H6657_30800 [Ardenticatenaceae bacterium]|nr:hypothetical protein [Anaerolineales bacterium]MCB8981819.1 hypothetical protein [Ardenticatenaceae bacterium]
MSSAICEKITRLFSEFTRYTFPFEKSEIPSNGIYILFEKGEYGHGVERIVRIGTHTGNNKLPARLREHFLVENKDRSIFRKNIGRALLNADQDPYLKIWNLDLTQRNDKENFGHLVDSEKQQRIEKRVTDYLQHAFSFSVVHVVNKADRLRWEARMISTVSLCEACHPSPKWLGLQSPKAKIRESGLWQVNELYKQALSEQELEELRTDISR